MDRVRMNQKTSRAVAEIFAVVGTQLIGGFVLSPIGNQVVYAGNCDNITNTILAGQFNEACGTDNTVGGTFAGATPTNYNTGLGTSNNARNGDSTAVGHNNFATAVNTTAMGTNNEARGRDSTAVGANNTVGIVRTADPQNANDGAGSSAFGTLNLISTTASGDTGGSSTAIGSENNIFATRSTAVGFNNKVGDAFAASQGNYLEKSTAIGYQSWVFGNSSVVIGDSSEAGGSDQPGSPALFADRAVAIGHFARARVNGTIAIGDQALAGMSDLAGNGGVSFGSTNAIAIGTNAKVYGSNTTTGFASVAIGAQSQATGNNSVSLGAGSTDGGQSNVVSVGSSADQRRIINVAAGINQTDAVNVSQLQSLDSRLSGQMNEIGDKAYAGTAMVAAIAGIPTLSQDKRFNVGVGFGNYQGQSGAAIGGNVRLNDVMIIKAAVGYANSAATTSIGMGFSF